ncbi:MAG: 2-hydroxyglutaryl-CoA dehydratase [Deltaproteobacteria bacterium]|nr:2-hydroxyglutaryl-CoA dehydratase [Deltaproteobacteria bacterium]
MPGYLGIDVGSISTNLVMIDDSGAVVAKRYLRTRGQPVQAVQEGLKALRQGLPASWTVAGVGTTGSGRFITGLLAGADVIKNEITAHALAALHIHPAVQTILEIGGQDSKGIIIRNRTVVDFDMNTVCAAGTGSFLDQQAFRLGIPIEDFGPLALKSRRPTKIAGRCTVFAESDMIHKQQMGYAKEDIIAGLCQALVRNYLNNLFKGKEIREPVLFQGGVAANQGMVKAFEEALGLRVIVPDHFEVMGAIGMALLARDTGRERAATRFRGFELDQVAYQFDTMECNGCTNRCEIFSFQAERDERIYWGDRCGRWENMV